MGYTWLIVFWLAFVHNLSASTMPDVYVQIVNGLDRVGTATAGVVASVAAYLVGVVAVSITLRLTANLGTFLRLTPFRRLTPTRWSNNRLRPVLERLVLRRLRARLTSDPDFLSKVVTPPVEVLPKPAVFHPRRRREWHRRKELTDMRAALDPRAYIGVSDQRALFRSILDVDRLVDGIEADLDSIALRLRSTHYPLYDEYDRLQSEAEFRVAMFPAIATLFAVLAVRWSPLWLVGAAVALTLLYVGAAARAKAGQVVVNALVALDIDDPALERVDVGPLPLK